MKSVHFVVLLVLVAAVSGYVTGTIHSRKSVQAPISIVNHEAVYSEENHKTGYSNNYPDRVSSQAISGEEFDGNNVGDKLFGHVNGNIFYVHESMIIAHNEQLFIQVYEDNRSNKKFTPVPEKWEKKNGQATGYTPAHYIDENGARVDHISKDLNIFHDSGMADFVETIKIGEYYVAKTEKVYQKPIFVFSHRSLGLYYPHSSPNSEEVMESIVFNQAGGTLFSVVD